MGEIKGVHTSPGIYTRITNLKKTSKTRAIITNNGSGNNTNSNVGNNSSVDVEKCGINSPQITNIYNQAYIKHQVRDSEGNEYTTYKQFYGDIMFNLSHDIKYLWDVKDDFFVTLSRYSRKYKKYTLFNDLKQSDERLKMYCWVIKGGNEDKTFWTYFYTTLNYNDDPYQMWEETEYGLNDIYTCRLFYEDDINQSSLCMSNNYVTSINQLIREQNETLNDNYSVEEIERYIEGDVDSYYVDALSSNPIRKWVVNEYGRVGYGGGNAYESYIEGNKTSFMDWVSMRSQKLQALLDGEETIFEYKFSVYCGDYPIEPVKLSDCYVQIYGEYAKKHFDSGNTRWIKFSELNKSDLELLEEVVFRLPYNSNYILARLYCHTDFLYREWNEQIYYEELNGANRIGASYDVDIEERDTSLITNLRLGICNKKQIITNRYRSFQECKFKIISYYNKYLKEDTIAGEKRNVVISNIRY
jgi:hypothetical protein